MKYFYVTETGEKLPITDMFDIDKDRTEDPALAVTMVAMMPNGKWLAARCQPEWVIKAEYS